MTILHWGFLLGLPLVIFGAVIFVMSEKAKLLIDRFENSKLAAAVITVFAWFWTAWECHIIGIDVFDMFLKRFPGQLWIMAAVLSYLTIIWMPKNLSVRALAGVFMLIPAELFKVTRFLLPEGGLALCHIFVVYAYILAVIGMYGMFYPWKIETALERISSRHRIFRLFGCVLFVAGVVLISAGCVL